MYMNAVCMKEILVRVMIVNHKISSIYVSTAKKEASKHSVCKRNCMYHYCKGKGH